MLNKQRFNLQLFGDSEIDTSGEDIFKMTDPVTGLPVEMPGNLKTVIGHIISSTRGAAKSDIKKQYDPLKQKIEELSTQNQTLLTQLEELQEKSMTDDEKKKAAKKKEQEEYEGRLKKTEEKAEFWKSKWYKDKMENDIFKAFEGHNLRNIEDTALIFSNKGNVRIEEIKDEAGNIIDYKTVVTLSLQKENGEVEEITGNPKDLFKKWVSQPNNQHHLLNTLNPGAGSQIGGRGEVNPITIKEQISKLKEDYKKSGDPGIMRQIVILKDKLIAEGKGVK